MNNSVKDKIKVAGLIIMLALLLFCAWSDVQKRTKKTIDTTEEQEIQETEANESMRIVDPNKPMIALTFDDGPGKYTMQLLEQLEAYNSVATFFMVGDNVADYPDAVKKMREIGCEFGNHTMHHARLTKFATDEEIVAEIAGTNTALYRVVGQESSFLRPPYGSVDERVSALANAPLVMWSVDTRDWESKDIVAIRDHVLGIVQDGDIVLMHDIHETTMQAAEELIPQLIEKGYQLVTVSEMAEARGMTLENGVKYYDFKK